MSDSDKNGGRGRGRGRGRARRGNGSNPQEEVRRPGSRGVAELLSDMHLEGNGNEDPRPSTSSSTGGSGESGSTVLYSRAGQNQPGEGVLYSRAAAGSDGHGGARPNDAEGRNHSGQPVDRNGHGGARPKERNHVSGPSAGRGNGCGARRPDQIVGDVTCQPGLADCESDRVNMNSVRTRRARGPKVPGLGRTDEGSRDESRIPDHLVKTRPDGFEDKRGEYGQRVRLISNFFDVNLNLPSWILYKYSVTYDPPIDNRSLRRGLLNGHRDIIGGTFIMDGGTLVLPHRLPNDPMVFTTVVRHSNQNVQVTLRLVNELPPGGAELEQYLGILLRNALKAMGLSEIQRHFFNPRQGRRLEKHRLEVLPGFDSRISYYETDLKLSIDVVHKVVQLSTAYDVMADTVNACRNTRRDAQQEIKKEIVGAIVITRYNNRTYRVDDIDFNQTPLNSFESRGRKITFMEYYQQAHNIPIYNEGQPLLVSRPKKKDIRAGQDGLILLVPELCFMTGLPESVSKDMNMKKDLVQHTRVGPRDRVFRLQDFVQEFSRNESSRNHTEKWGLSIKTTPTEVDGRVLPPETIIQKRTTYSAGPNADWLKGRRGVALYRSVDIANWIVMYYPQAEAKAGELARTLQNLAGPMGFTLNTPRYVPLNNDHVNTYLTALSQTVNEQTQIAVIILRNDRQDRYDAIKRSLCVDHPVQSQVVLYKTLCKSLMSVCTNIAYQMQCKLGATAWTVPFPPQLAYTMIVGIDIFHEKNARSVVALCASLDPTFTRYFGIPEFLSQGQEIQENLMPMMSEALEKFHGVNGRLPAKVIIYRDGVGDGQLAAVKDRELNQIMLSFKRLYQDQLPQIAMIVVKKRLSTRFFMKFPNGGIENPPPGTIVDSQVTRAIHYDFYLVSQSVSQGTVSPTLYNVVYDTSGLKPDYLQRLTYKMTHLYANWPGTIRVPAPCMYAHKLAFQCGKHLLRQPHRALWETLFYL